MAGQWKKVRMGGRQWQRMYSRAIRGSWIRALAELITNGDDSYTRLEKAGAPASGRLVVEYERGRNGAGFRVIDEAEGMSAARLEEVFREYGGEIAAGPDARGFFNRGAKDALLAMQDGREDSIQNGEYASMELRPVAGEEPERRLTGPATATPRVHRRLGVRDNGTVASFRLPVEYKHIPQAETVRTALARFWMLRKIVDPSNTRRKLVLRFRGTEEEIEYPQPLGAVLIDKEFTLKVAGMPDFAYRLRLQRADQDLDQTVGSDQRVGGLLVVDEGDAVLDLTLGRFDRDPASAAFYGEVKLLGGFKSFLRDQEREGNAVLSEERNGFEASHAWVQALIRSLEDKIEPFVDEERKRRAKGQEDLTETERAQQARVMQELNKILEDETKKAWPGNEETDRVTVPAGGLEISPDDITINEGKLRYVLIRADPAKCPPGTLIYIEDNTGSLLIEPQEFNVEDDGEAVFVRPLRISGGSAGQAGQIIAISSDCEATAKYQVVADAYPEFDAEMAFVPAELDVVDQRQSFASLYVHTTAVPPGSSVWVTSSSPENVVVLSPATFFDPRDVRGTTGKLRVRVRGIGVGQKAVLTARFEDSTAEAAVTVRSQRVPTPPNKKGLFKGIEYSLTASATERVHFDTDKGKFVVHLAEPTVAFHLGDAGRFRELLNAKTLVAELVTQMVASEIATLKVESGARIYFDPTPAGRFQEDQDEMRALVHRHGATIHKLVVEAGALREARKVEA